VLHRRGDNAVRIGAGRHLANSSAASRREAGQWARTAALQVQRNRHRNQPRRDTPLSPSRHSCG